MELSPTRELLSWCDLVIRGAHSSLFTKDAQATVTVLTRETVSRSPVAVLDGGSPAHLVVKMTHN